MVFPIFKSAFLLSISSTIETDEIGFAPRRKIVLRASPASLMENEFDEGVAIIELPSLLNCNSPLQSRPMYLR